MRLAGCALIVAALALVTTPIGAQQPVTRRATATAVHTEAALTNGDVVALARAGFSDALVVAQIQGASRKTFDLSVAGLLALKSAGVSERVVSVMLGQPDPGEEPRVIASAPNVAEANIAAGNRVSVPAGTEVRLQLMTTLSSKTSRTGDIVQMTAAEDVLVQGRVVIPKGAAAWGIVSNATPQRLVRPGSLELSITSVKDARGAEVKLSGNFSARAGRGLVTGDELSVQTGTVVRATIEREHQVEGAKAADAGMMPARVATPFASSDAGPVAKDGLSHPAPVSPSETRREGIYLEIATAPAVTTMLLEATVGRTKKEQNIGLNLLGVKRIKWGLQVAGPTSARRVSTRQPVFYFYFDRTSGSSLNPLAGPSTPNEFVLAKLRRDDDHRELSTDSIWQTKDAIPFRVERGADGGYRVTTGKPLEGGAEYAFFHSATAQAASSETGAAATTPLFDFGID